MKIAYPYPTYWPYVRRGVERSIHDLSNYLAERGHEVDIITSKPGRLRVGHDGQVRVVYLPQVSHPLGYRYLPHLRLYGFGLAATRLLLKEKYDVAHLWAYSSIMAAPLLKRWRNMPYLFHLMLRYHPWPGRLDRWAFRNLLKHANRVAALTPNATDEACQQWGVDAITLPPPVNMESFRPCAPTDLDRPRVLFTGDLGDARKGAPLLFRAWADIHRRCPDAVLVLAGPFGVVGFDSEFEVYALQRLDLIRTASARAAVEILGPGSPERLPYEYSRAAVTVLPSVEEAFGMVVTESLSCGTPVVCSAYDGPGEIVRSPEVGVTVPLKTPADLMSERASQQLADAVVEAIELARKPETARRCREWVEPYGLETVGARLEAELLTMADAGRSASQNLMEISA